MIGRILTAGERMGQLIEDLLRLSRVSGVGGDAELLRIKGDGLELIRAAWSGLAAADPRTAHVTLDLPDSLSLDGDPRLLRVVFENLLANAVKFSRNVASPRVSVRQENGVYTVEDNGTGFDMAYASKLFKPFQRLHSSHEFEGSGIGLAIVDRIVRRHGGRIWADGTAGGGARFHFTLALSAEKA
jgi:signal transduction histidine kinase